MRIVVGVTGASGTIYALKLLKNLRALGIEIHLIITKSGEEVLYLENSLTRKDLNVFTNFFYKNEDLKAPISSGSFKTDGMIVVPCSMKTLAGLSNGYSSNLLLRAADVTLKERRKLVIVPRETPLNIIHLKNMMKIVQAGGILLPAMPGFYQDPKSIDDLISHIVGKILESFNLEHRLYRRWGAV